MTITDIFVAVGFCLLLIVISPILVPLLAFAYLKSKFENARLGRFLARNEGAKYFCYTNKKTGLQFARESILPNLDPDVRIIYMSQNGRINLGDESMITLTLEWKLAERNVAATLASRKLSTANSSASRLTLSFIESSRETLIRKHYSVTYRTFTTPLIRTSGWLRTGTIYFSKNLAIPS